MIYTDEFLRVEFEESEVAWVKIFTNNETKEISQLCEKTRERLFRAALVCERAMIEFYKPEKTAWASQVSCFFAYTRVFLAMRAMAVVRSSVPSK